MHDVYYDVFLGFINSHSLHKRSACLCAGYIGYLQHIWAPAALHRKLDAVFRLSLNFWSPYPVVVTGRRACSKASLPSRLVNKHLPRNTGNIVIGLYRTTTSTAPLLSLNHPTFYAKQLGFRDPKLSLYHSFYMGKQKYTCYMCIPDTINMNMYTKICRKYHPITIEVESSTHTYKRKRQKEV